jgi:lysophospholipase L1-like esterase
MLAVGDSIIAGVGAPTVFDALPGQVAAELARLLERKVSWSASGVIGITSSGIKRRLLQTLPPESFDAVVLSVGVNDVTAMRTVRKWSTDLGHVLDELRKHSPDAPIALLGLPPLSSFPLLPRSLQVVMGIRARMFDDTSKREAAKRDNVVHVPIEMDASPDRFSPDGFHPSLSGYKELGRHVATALASRFSP